MQSPGPLGTSGADSLQPCQQGASKRNRKFRRVRSHEEPSRLWARMCEDTSFGEDFKLHLGCPVCSASLPITAGHERLT